MMLLKPLLQLRVAMATAGSAAKRWWRTTILCDSVCCEEGRRAYAAVTGEDHHGAGKYFPLHRNWRRSHLTGTMHAAKHVGKCVYMCMHADVWTRASMLYTRLCWLHAVIMMCANFALCRFPCMQWAGAFFFLLFLVLTGADIQS